MAAFAVWRLGLGERRAADMRPFWTIARLAGAPVVGSERIIGAGRLRVGEWVQTDARSRAQVRVADIGEITVEPNSRLGLIRTRPTEHRLSLQQGKLRAHVTAPPRLFVVETPSAEAVDLGCAYTLEVDPHGGSLIEVTLGYVAFEWHGRESVVPAGATCRTKPGMGPGTPYFAGSSRHLKEALDRYDFGQGGLEALKAVLANATKRDCLTLWHLLYRADTTERALVYDRLAGLVPPPGGVTRTGALRLDPGMMEKWRSAVEPTWWE